MFFTPNKMVFMFAKLGFPFTRIRYSGASPSKGSGYIVFTPDAPKALYRSSFSLPKASKSISKLLADGQISSGVEAPKRVAFSGIST